MPKSSALKSFSQVVIDPQLQAIEAEEYCRKLYEYNDKELFAIEYEECRRNKIHCFKHWFWIDSIYGGFTRLFLNNTQSIYFHEQTIRDLILKSRKRGMSTLIDMDFLHDCLFIPGTKALLLADKAENSEVLFKKLLMAYNELPHFLKPKKRYSSKRELEFVASPYGHKLDTNFTVATAGADEIRRGTDIDRFHQSEAAFYRDIDTVNTGPMQALRPGAKVRIESTPNGDNHFKEDYLAAKAGESDFKAHFYPWHSDRNNQDVILEGEEFERTEKEDKLVFAYDLTDEQVKWRRKKKKELKRKFPQEFPDDDVSCFLMGGDCIFDTEVLNDMLAFALQQTPVETRQNGIIKIWKKVKDYEGYKYLSGWDTSEGEPTGNPAGLVLLDYESGEFVADCYGHLSPKRLAKYGHELCVEYNCAVEGVERNNHGGTVLFALRDIHHSTNIYHHQEHDEHKRKKVRKPGWNTTAKSKQIMVDDFVEAVNERLVTIYNPEMIRQMMTCVWEGDRVVQGKGTGHHADMAIMGMIAWQMFKTPKVRVRVI